MAAKKQITRAKGVELCVNLMYAGQPRKEIVPNLTESYGVSVSTVEKWMRIAAPFVENRQKEDEEVRRRESAAFVTDAAKSLNISKQRVLEEYAKIAFLDVRKFFTVDGGIKPLHDLDDETAAAIAGIENYDERERETGEILGTTKKIKISDKRGALDSICRVLGYNAPTTVAQTDKDGNDIESRLDKLSTEEMLSLSMIQDKLHASSN